MATFHLARSRRLALWVIATTLATLVVAPGVNGGRPFGEWGTAAPETALNSAQADGCPIESFDGLSLYLASTRPGAVGGDTDPNDIWVARRDAIDAPWHSAVHLPAPVNSAAADFCPLPLPGRKLFFVSSRAGTGACGAGDIYRTRKHPVNGWLVPTNLGCVATDTGPNFAGAEFSPSLIETSAGTFLYFSSTGLDGLDQDIYVSRQDSDGSFGQPALVDELSTTANDQMPNVSRDGLEIVFVSDRTGGAGGLDVYTANRASTADPWSTPARLGPGVNTAASESRPSLSGDGERLHFGRLGDIWVSSRQAVHP